jgi:hypothetical protein
MADKKNSGITTIKLSKETKERLDKLKEYRRESYDDLLRKMLGILNLSRADPDKARVILNKIYKTYRSGQKYTEVYEEDKNENKEKAKINFAGTSK